LDGNYARAEFAQVIKMTQNKEIDSCKKMNLDNYADAILMADKALKWLMMLTLSFLKLLPTEKTNNPQESLTIIETILEKIQVIKSIRL
jgi:hypothetical protein